jgi:hypothetical protein
VTRRVFTSIAWLLATWTGFGALALIAGLPDWLGPASGLVVAGLIGWDPAGWLWKPRPSAAARRRLADLARVSDTANAAEAHRRVEIAEG